MRSIQIAVGHKARDLDRCCFAAIDTPADDWREPECFSDPEYRMVLAATCPKCHKPWTVLLCARHTHLVLERIGPLVQSVLPVDYEEPANFVPPEWCGQ